MMTPDATAITRIAHRIAPHSQVLNIWPLTGGSSMHMMAFMLQHRNGQTQTLIIRQPNATRLQQDPHAAAHEYRLLQQLQTVPAIAAPEPVLLDTSGEILPAPYLVITYMDGELDFSPPHLPDAMRQFAAQLAHIHQVDIAALELSFLPTHEFSTQAIASTTDTEAIQSALNRITAPVSSAAALLHGDFWPGNVLWRDGRLTAVLDWEDALIGNPLADFAISRLDVLLIFGQQAMQTFTHAYQSLSSLNFAQLPYWDLRAARRAAPHLGEWPTGYAAYGRADITEATMRQAHTWFVAQALQALDESA